MDPIPLDLDECEGIAAGFILAIGEDDTAAIDPLEALVRAGYRLSPDAPRGCVALVERDTVRLSTLGSSQRVQSRARHELGHVALRLAGVRKPHHEPTADLVGLMVALPRRAVLHALRAPFRFPIAFPGVPEADLRRRIELIESGHNVENSILMRGAKEKTA